MESVGEVGERILDGTVKAVGKYGNDVTINQIAAEAGVSHGTVYNHFPDKADLFAATGVYTFDLFARWARPALERIEQPIERVATFGRYMLRMPETHPDYAISLWVTSRYTWNGKYRGREEAILAQDVAAGAIMGQFSTHLIEQRVANAIGSILHNITLRLLNPNNITDHYCDGAIEVILIGLGAKPQQAAEAAHKRLPRRPAI